MMAMSPVTARISTIWGPRTSLQIGLVIIAAAYGAGTMLLSAAWQVSLVIAVIGAGVALAYGALPALIMRAVPTTRTAAANGLNTLMRSIGTSTASAVAAVVLSASTVPVEGTLVPSLGALRTTLIIAAGCAVLALLVSLAVPSLPDPARRVEPFGDDAPDGSVADEPAAPAPVRGRVLHDHGAPATGAPRDARGSRRPAARGHPRRSRRRVRRGPRYGAPRPAHRGARRRPARGRPRRPGPGHPRPPARAWRRPGS